MNGPGELTCDDGSTYYTDENRNITHVDKQVPNTPLRDGLHRDPDASRFEPGVTYRLETGVGDPHVLVGRDFTPFPQIGPLRADTDAPNADSPNAGSPGAPEADPPGIRSPDRFEGFDNGQTPPAVHWDPPGDPELGGRYHDQPTVDGYDPRPEPDGSGPFSTRNHEPPLQPHSRYEVNGPDDEWHGTFYTDADGRISHVQTWSGNQANGFNPELGNDATWGTCPLPDTTYAVGPRHVDGLGPRTPMQMCRTDVHGDTIAASGRPHYAPDGVDTKSYYEGRRGEIPGKIAEGVQSDVGRIAGGGSAGKTDASAGEYAAANYNPADAKQFKWAGGHIVAYEMGGPGERINHVPQWAHENSGYKIDGRGRPDTWYGMETDIGKLARQDGTSVDRIDFFAERRTQDVHTPDVLHTRVQVTDATGPGTHTRSFHNVPPAARGPKYKPAPRPVLAVRRSCSRASDAIWLPCCRRGGTGRTFDSSTRRWSATRSWPC